MDNLFFLDDVFLQEKNIWFLNDIANTFCQLYTFLMHGNVWNERWN